ncbi:ARM repeat-containing protein [Hysterangium stoloniferum]|nr:ARM repeat-containing protein [Hysterangium stoloniferum]
MANETSLKALSQKHRDSPTEKLLPEELTLLIDAFIPTPEDSSIRALSLLFLSQFSSNIRYKYATQSDTDIATAVLVRTFAPLIETRLGETQESTTLSGINFLASFFQVDPRSGSQIFLRDGLVDAVMDAIDLYPSSRAVPVAIANLFSQASGNRECRPELSSPEIKSWLEVKSRQTNDSSLRASAAVALVKLSRGSRADAENSAVNGISTSTPKDEINNGEDEVKLVELMRNLVISEGQPSSATLDAVEGLAYLTVQPMIKESISRDSALLKSLISLIPRRSNAPSFPASHADHTSQMPTNQNIDLGLHYGIAAIIFNICSYKPRLSDEEQQMEKLKRMARVPVGDGKLSASDASALSDVEKLDDDSHVAARGKRLLDCGILDALSGIIKQGGGRSLGNRNTAIQRIQRAAAASILALIEDKSNRGKILQGGGARALLAIVQSSLADLLSREGNAQQMVDALDSADLAAIQALAKLSITSPPPAVFGSAQDSYIDAMRPFAILLCHSSSSLLQRFEAIMALTNIASVSLEAAERVTETTVGDIVKRVEGLLLENNTFLRRAATELVCNLVNGANGSFEYFGGTAKSNAKSRLLILIALSDVEDLQTRLAASGALAILTVSPFACQSLAKLEIERHRVLPILVELISPEIAQEYREEIEEDSEEQEERRGSGDPGLVHRGVVCVRNLFANIEGQDERKAMSLEAEKSGLVRALIQTIKSSPADTDNNVILKPAAEVLKWILQAGVKLPL